MFADMSDRRLSEQRVALSSAAARTQTPGRTASRSRQSYWYTLRGIGGGLM